MYVIQNNYKKYYFQGFSKMDTEWTYDRSRAKKYDTYDDAYKDAHIMKGYTIKEIEKELKNERTI